MSSIQSFTWFLVVIIVVCILAFLFLATCCLAVIKRNNCWCYRIPSLPVNRDRDGEYNNFIERRPSTRLRQMMITVQKSLKNMPVFSGARLKLDLNVEETDTCSICLDFYEHTQIVRQLPCKHIYHVKCIDPWLLVNHVCPLCKADIFARSSS